MTLREIRHNHYLRNRIAYLFHEVDIAKRNHAIRKAANKVHWCNGFEPKCKVLIFSYCVYPLVNIQSSPCESIYLYI